MLHGPDAGYTPEASMLRPHTEYRVNWQCI